MKLQAGKYYKGTRVNPKNEIPIPVLKLTVGFNPVEGKLWWLERGPHWFLDTKDPIKESKRWNTRYCGNPAFNTLNKYGYLCGRFRGVSLYAHRVMWALMCDEWAYPFLDHINGNRSDNRISNLRVVDKLINNRSASLRSDNNSGYSGVICRPNGKYQVNVRYDGKQNYQGTFETIEEAIRARDLAYNLHGYSERHGK